MDLVKVAESFAYWSTWSLMFLLGFICFYGLFLEQYFGELPKWLDF